MTRIARIIVAATAALTLLTIAPAAAHTTLVVAGGQIVNGGYINGGGILPNQQIDDGPATDGTVNWVNLDPVSHRFVGVCSAAPASGGGCTVGQQYFNVLIGTGENKGVAGLLPGTYRYSDSAAGMQGIFRVTSRH